MAHPLRVAVIGAGAFGRNHLRVFHDLTAHSGATQLPQDVRNAQNSQDPQDSQVPQVPRVPQAPPVQLAAVVDRDPDTRSEAAQRYGVPAFASIDDLLAAGLALDAATVCVPTVAHSAAAEHLLAAGLDLLIEKPITATLEQADRLIALAHANGRILAAGHLERFNPAVTAALTRLTRPMFFEAHRLSVFTPRSLDVDVVLDLMIHDLDILLTMAQSPVREVRAVGLPVLSREVDIANVRLEFDSGAVANLTASRVSTEQVRKLRLFQPAQYLSLDYARQELLTVNVNPDLADLSSRPEPRSAAEEGPLYLAKASSAQNLSSRPEPRSATDLSSRPEPRSATDLSSRPEPRSATDLSSRPERASSAQWRDPCISAPPQNPTSPAPQPHPSAGLTFEKLDLPRVEPLRLELEDFLQAVATRSAPRVPAQAAREALALALEINAAIATHAGRTGLTH